MKNKHNHIETISAIVLIIVLFLLPFLVMIIQK